MFGAGVRAMSTAGTGNVLSKGERSGGGDGVKVEQVASRSLGRPQTLVALRRVQALQQRWPGVAPEAVENPPAGTAEDHEGGVAYTDQDRKILQLCGEDPAEPVLGAGQSRTWRGGASVVDLRDGARPGEGRGRSLSRTHRWSGR